MTAKEITLGLCLPRYRKTLCLPRYTPKGWWECDVAEFTVAGYLREYEIKVSRADFRNDAKKQSQLTWWARQHGHTGGVKHEKLAAGSPSGPVQFWFVVPKGLVELSEVPDFAGLIEVDGSRGWRSGYIDEVETKPAPRLHNEKADPAIIRHARGVCYYRMWNTAVQNMKLARVEARNTKALRAFGWPKKKPPTV